MSSLRQSISLAPDDSFNLFGYVLQTAEEKGWVLEDLQRRSLYEKFDLDVSIVHYSAVAGTYPGMELADHLHRDKSTSGFFELRRVIDLEQSAASFIVNGPGRYEPHASVIKNILDSFKFYFEDWRNAQARQSVIEERERETRLSQIDLPDLPDFPEEIAYLTLVTQVLLSDTSRDALELYDSTILCLALDERIDGLSTSEASRVIKADEKSLSAWIDEKPSERQFLGLICDIMVFKSMDLGSSP